MTYTEGLLNAEQAVESDAGKWENKGEPDRGVCAPQPGSDHLLDSTERG